MARKTKAQRKERRKKFFAKAKEAVKKVAAAPAKAAVFAVLIPFQPMMKSVLKKRGFTPEKKLSKLANQFFEKVVKKENFESQYLYFEAEYAEAGGAGAGDAAKGLDAGLIVGTIGDIVNAIKNWIQRRKEKLKEKEAAGETLTEGEKNFVDNTEAIQDAANEAIRGEITETVQQKTGQFITSPVGLILIAGAAYFLIKKS
jgi:hypothetical protein